MKKTLRKLLIITIYIGLILINTKVNAASTGTTINETTRIRKEASTTSDVVALVNENTEVNIDSEEGEWYKVKYKNYTGYIRKDLLEVKEDTSTVEDNDNTSKNDTTASSNETENNNDSKLNEETTTQELVEVLKIGYKGNISKSIDIKLVPTINSSVITTLPENTEITITDIINKWCYIETANSCGWTLLSKIESKVQEENNKENVTEEESEEKEEESEQATEEDNKQNIEEKEKEEEKPKTITKYVSTETLNVRERPENEAKIVAQITLNTQVTIIETVDSTWSKVKVKNTEGYVASKFLSDKKTNNTSRSESEERANVVNTSAIQSQKEEAAQNNNSSNEAEKKNEKSESSSSNSGVTGSAVVAYAKQYLGYKYVSGGASPSTGFDCSGFTSYVYKHFGYKLNRVSRDQINNGTSVSKSELKEGDIVLFKGSSGSSIGHVGIYIGGNTFIHAANPSKGVITTSMSDSYYSQRYVAARRIIN